METFLLPAMKKGTLMKDSGKDQIKVSVIIPTYNNKESLRLVLKSLVYQNFPRRSYEIIVADDGSSDGTKEMVMSFKEETRFESLRYFFQEDKGFRAGQARNLGARHAQGKILVFLDDDSLAHPRLLQQHLKRHFSRDKNTDIEGGDWSMSEVILGYNASYGNSTDYNLKEIEPLLEGTNKLNELKIIPEFRNEHFMNKQLNNSLTNPKLWWIFAAGNMSIPKALFDQFRFDEDFVGWAEEDVELGFRLHKSGRVLRLVPQCLAYNIRQKVDGMIGVLTRDKFISTTKNQVLFYKKHREPEVRQYVENRYAYVPEKFKKNTFLDLNKLQFTVDNDINIPTKKYDTILISTHFDYDENLMPILSDSDVSTILPIGMLSIAQHLHDKGYKVKVIHLPSFIEKDPKKILKRYNSEIALIQCHWYLYGSGAIKMAGLYKSMHPDSKIFLEGIHATYYATEILENHKAVKGIILSEAEVAAERLADKIISGQDISDIPGICIRINDKTKEIKINPHTKGSLLDISKIPLINLGLGIYHDLDFGHFFFMHTTRGRCPNKCAYCVGNNPGFNHRNVEHIPFKRIIEQIQLHKENKIKELFFGEVEFTNRDFRKDLVKAITTEKTDIYFGLETNPSLMTKEMTEILKKANFLRFSLGCESGSDQLLSRIGRNVSQKNILDAVKNISSNDCHVMTSWIANLPTENKNDFNQTLSAMRDISNEGGSIYRIENLHVLPGTEFFEKPEKYNIIPLLKRFSDWSRWATVSKNNVSFEEMARDPLKYLTHKDKSTSTDLMIKKLAAMRILALNSVDTQIEKIARNKDMDTFIANEEIKTLEWFKRKGYKVLLF